MANSPYVKAALAQAALELVPPRIRKTLVADGGFREDYDLTTDGVLSFGDSGVSAQRSDLSNAVRALLSGNTEAQVTDTRGRPWGLSSISGEGDLPQLALTRGTQRLILPDFCALSRDRATRLRSLDEAASEHNLPSSARDRWRGVLAERALEDDELDAYHSEFRDTLVHTARSIRGEIARGQTSMACLVPRSRRYFERLVGAFDGSATIREYAAASGRAVCGQLSAWRPYQGLLCSLFLSSHPSLTAEINVDELGRDDFGRALDFLEEHGDIVSQLGAIEVGLRVLPSRPETEAVLVRLIEQTRDDDATSQASGFKLLSALFVRVLGTIRG